MPQHAATDALDHAGAQALMGEGYNCARGNRMIMAAIDMLVMAMCAHGPACRRVASCMSDDCISLGDDVSKKCTDDFAGCGMSGNNHDIRSQ